MCERFRGRRYIDHRTRRYKAARFYRNWEPHYDEMVTAYLDGFERQFQQKSDIGIQATDNATAPDKISKNSHPRSPAESESESESESDTSMASQTSGSPLPVHPTPNAAPEHGFEIDVFDIFTLDNRKFIHRDSTSPSIADALMCNGYVGSSPESPTLAFSVRTLDLFRSIRLRKPSFSVEAFTKVLCDLYNVS